jgi:hypothetical protein
MNIYYIDNKNIQKFNLKNIAIKGDINTRQLSAEILKNPNFCREETSISVSDLISYIFDGITLYIENNGILKGVINFDINIDAINIYGLCVPIPSAGVGSILINTVKNFATVNKLKIIKLTCYGNVVDFYKRNGFAIQSQNEYIEDSDEESDDEMVTKTKYEMIYTINYGGKKRKYKKNNKKTKKMIKNKIKKNKSIKSIKSIKLSK